MSVNVNIFKNAQSLDISDRQRSYSKVVITVGQDGNGENISFSAGDDTGSVLYIDNPFGTQAMANAILNDIRGFQYQPYESNGAMLDPAAEIGDGVIINNVPSGIYNRTTNFGSLMTHDLSAPTSEEIEHEFDVSDDVQEQRFNSFIASTKSSLNILGNQISAEVQQRTASDETLTGLISATAQSITAKVSKTGGDSSSFGWELTDNSWTLTSNGTQVFKANSNGVQIEGTISATSGGIAGFNISSNAIWNGIPSYGGSQSSGVYIGTNGIQLGQGFKVDSSGHVTASNGTFTGTLDCRSLIINGESISPSLFRSSLSGGSSYNSSGFSGSGSSLSTTYLKVTYLSGSNINLSGGISTGSGISCAGSLTVGESLSIGGKSVSKYSKKLVTGFDFRSSHYTAVKNTSGTTVNVLKAASVSNAATYTTLYYWG